MNTEVAAAFSHFDSNFGANELVAQLLNSLAQDFQSERYPKIFEIISKASNQNFPKFIKFSLWSPECISYVMI